MKLLLVVVIEEENEDVKLREAFRFCPTRRLKWWQPRPLPCVPDSQRNESEENSPSTCIRCLPIVIQQQNED